LEEWKQLSKSLVYKVNCISLGALTPRWRHSALGTVFPKDSIDDTEDQAWLARMNLKIRTRLVLKKLVLWGLIKLWLIKSSLRRLKNAFS